MIDALERARLLFDRFAPEGTPRRKLLQILAIILLVEGLSVFALFSYVGLLLGAVSVVVGFALLAMIYRRPSEAVSKKDPPGIRLIEYLVKLVGGDYVVMILGAVVVLLVVLYNRFVSTRSGYGDVDTLSILFGIVLLAYPVLAERFRIEAGFALLFVAFVVVILVVPQAVVSLTGNTGSTTVGNWYVHYMLAAPFAGSLDLMGIPAHAMGEMVTLTFKDGSVHTLSISAYCAGLYSFSIFLSAFLSFVLVFERLRTRTLIIVMLIGLLIAYLGNIVRMIIIGVIGYYNGISSLLWAHENVGWIIFLGWSSAFWYALLRYSSGRHQVDVDHTEVH
jgi:archaeosortase C (PEF-CTERM variant)